ncbi:UAA transporter [Umbelopsis sp. PMI_123]|nr:UAA transporter [Umbelopsis sp. PMI_123]
MKAERRNKLETRQPPLEQPNHSFPSAIKSMSVETTKPTHYSFTKSLFQIFANEYILILSLIFGGCCSNVFALEILVSDAPKSGQLITLGQFIFVAIEGLFHHLQWPSATGYWWWPTFLPSLKPRTVPIQRWFLVVIVFYTVSALNNIALGFNISMPLHIIFRSGGLIVNMFMGWLLLSKKYSKGQVLAVILVTVGVIWATIASTKVESKSETDSSSAVALGITILSIAMVLSACLGLLQEVTYRKYGKAWREGLFYTHGLSLPIFLFFYKDIWTQLQIYNQSPLVSPLQLVEKIPFAGDIISASLANILTSIQIPKLWYYLIMDVLTQYVCISGVNRMTAVSSSLTLNLVLNLRKFTSLVISIVYFKNPFDIGAFFGSVLVFIGTVMYTQSASWPPAPTKKSQ